MTSETSENTILPNLRNQTTMCYSLHDLKSCLLRFTSVKKGQWANWALNYQTKMFNSDLNKANTLMKVTQRNYEAKMTSEDRIQGSACPEFSRVVCTLFMPRMLSARVFEN